MAKNANVKADVDKCKGCSTCEMVCSLVKSGVANPALSRIRVSAQPGHITFQNCDGCGACTRFCVFGALEVVQV